MFVLFQFSVALLPPGTHRATTNYISWMCPNATGGSVAGGDNYCFDEFYTFPKAGCRHNDTKCSSGQRVVSSVKNSYKSVFCSEYTFNWTCANYATQWCGTQWCDAAAACNSGGCECPEPMFENTDGQCVCPKPMVKDEHGECVCPDGLPCAKHYSVNRRDVTDAPTAAPVPCFYQESDVDGAIVIITFTILGLAMGLALGAWYGAQFCASTQVQPVRTVNYGAAHPNGAPSPA